ncbi:MAG: secretin N-terminal domain-containing protein [Methylococcaceae bacterium]|jgi:type II secretory pathway component GspD/PulD (secretin)
MRKKPWFFILCLPLISITPSHTEEAVLTVIPVNNRPAEELKPLLEPLLENGKVMADGANLIISTTPDRLPEIKALIRKLDVSPANLIITVIQSSSANASELNAQTHATLNRPNYRISPNTSIASGHYYQTDEQTNHDSTQIIRTLDGNPAFISSGRLSPNTTSQIYGNAYGPPAINTQTQYIATSSGFAVTPRLLDNEVILDIQPWLEQTNRRRQIETQNAHTNLRIRLGEWIELGNSDENSQRANSSNFARVRQTDSNQIHLLIKVDKVDNSNRR